MLQHQAIIGTQWGDEGKGKIVDYLAAKHDVIVRFQGGPNAGHTVVLNKKKFPLHVLPSGILYPDKDCVIADGVIIQPLSLVEELTQLSKQVKKRARVKLSTKAHLIMPWHEIRDAISGGKVGTTHKGIGPTYADAAARTGIRVGDILDKDYFRKRIKEEIAWNLLLIEALCKHFHVSKSDLAKLEIQKILDANRVFKDYVKALETAFSLGVELIDTSAHLYSSVESGKTILFEGAQATLLDISHGDYPYVTSSHPTLGGISIGTGIRPDKLEVIGVVKAYATRVGNGPFPTELSNGTGEKLRDLGHEFGTTTGRPRRCGWLDLVIINYAKRINGLNSLALTKLDVLTGFESIQVAVAYQTDKSITQDYPALIQDKETAIPLYREFSGWKQDISLVSKYADLPKQAKDFIEFIESQTQLPVKFIGVGPERSQLILR